MRTIDVKSMTMIKQGMRCESPLPLRIPDIISLMERNEEYIYWFQPTGGDVKTQVACVNINDVFYALNLKLEKAIFRHVRLTKNFVNLEVLQDGTKKLRIPIRLMQEKMRMSHRVLNMDGCKADKSRKKARVLTKKRHSASLYQIEDVDAMFEAMRYALRDVGDVVVPLVSTPETILQQMQTSFQYEFPHLQLHVTPRLES